MYLSTACLTGAKTEKINNREFQMDIQSLIFLLMDLAGTIAFAASGAIVAIRQKMDLFGVCVLGVCTAVGGGMVRDVILGMIPAALHDPKYVAVAAVTSLIVFLIFYFKQEFFEGRARVYYDLVMLVMDTIGLGIFTVFGVKAGVDAGYMDNTFLLAFLGTMTGVGGGLLRDMMAEVPPYIFVRHVYACASIVGAVLCVWLYRLAGEMPALILGSVCVILIRYLAAHYRWNLPRIPEKKNIKK